MYEVKTTPRVAVLAHLWLAMVILNHYLNIVLSKNTITKLTDYLLIHVIVMSVWDSDHMLETYGVL